MFIFLDDVQIQKTGGSYVNRVKILSSQGVTWLSAPISRRYSGYRAIQEVSFASDDWQSGIKRRLHSSYRNHPCFGETMQLFEELFDSKPSSIADFNIVAITQISKAIGLSKTEFRRSSDFPVRAASNEGICQLVKQSGGDYYLSGEGAKNYFDPAVFAKAGVNVVWQGSPPFEYPQRGRSDFVRGLSILDCLMNVGLRGIGPVLRSV